MAYLILESGPQAGSSIEVPEPGLVVGRARGPSCDVGLGDPSVSGRHARVYLDGGRGAWVVRDLGSSNGTMVDGRAVDFCELEHGMRISFAGVEVQFSVQNPGLSPAPSPADNPPQPSASPSLLGPEPTARLGAPIADLEALRSNASFLEMISKGADLHLDVLAAELDALKAACALQDPAQAFLAVSRVVDAGKMDSALGELRGIRQAESGVLDSLLELLQKG